MDNLVKDLEPMLRELAEKLGTTSEYLWTVMIKQAPIAASTIGIGYIAILAFAGILFCVYCKVDKAVKDGTNGDAYFIVIIPSVVWLVASLVGFSTTIREFVTALFNPEYWALKEILSQIN